MHHQWAYKYVNYNTYGDMQLIDHLTCSFPAFWKIIFALLQCPLIRVRVGLKTWQYRGNAYYLNGQSVGTLVIALMIL